MKNGYGQVNLQDITDLKTALDLYYADKAAAAKFKVRIQISYKDSK